MSEHGKKMIAPIIITVLMIVYVLSLLLGFLWLGFPWYITLAGLIVGIIVIGLMIGVLFSRIKEIRSGEEDDLSKY